MARKVLVWSTVFAEQNANSGVSNALPWKSNRSEGDSFQKRLVAPGIFVYTGATRASVEGVECGHDMVT